LFILHQGCFSSHNCSGKFTVIEQQSPTTIPTQFPVSMPTHTTSALPTGPSFSPTIFPTVAPTFMPEISKNHSYTCSFYSAKNTNNAAVHYATCSFTACGGASLVISSNCGCVGDTYIRLYDETNLNLLASNDDYCGVCSQISYFVSGSSLNCNTFNLHQGCYSNRNCSATFTVTDQMVPTSYPSTTPFPTSTSLPTLDPTYKPSFLPTASPSNPTTTPSSTVVQACLTGSDPYNAQAIYVICNVNAERAWLSNYHAYNLYHIEAICQSLGYNTYGQVGGNCGTVCGYCDGNSHDCSNVGREIYDGAGYAGSDAYGVYYGYAIMWSCVGNLVEPTFLPTIATTEPSIEPTVEISNQPSFDSTGEPNFEATTSPISDSATSEPSFKDAIAPVSNSTVEPSFEPSFESSI
jgi:hypothetical protein